MNPKEKVASLVFNLNIDKEFYYLIPEQFEVNIGSVVLAPFGNSLKTGIVVSVTNIENINIAPDITLKSIKDVLRIEPLFEKQEFEFFKWISNYYLYPLGMVIFTAIPSGVVKETHTILTVNDETSDLSGTNLPEELIVKLKNGVKYKTVIEKYKISRYKIAKLINSGYIKKTFLQQKQSPKTTKFVVLNSGFEEPIKLTAKQKQVLEFIKEKKTLPLKEVKEKFGAYSKKILDRFLEKGLISFEEKREYREISQKIYGGFTDYKKPDNLTGEQEKALLSLLEGLNRGFGVYLLHGVTGSGKTEVYLQTIEKVMKNGGGAIVLVPEISLTPQLLGRFRSRFGNSVGVLHSKLTQAERVDQWEQIKKGRYRVVIGARSAIFAQVPNLKLIIVDEEHDTSYKQESGLRYNARDCAVIKAKLSNCPVILGSATPSIESMNNALKKKYELLTLKHRVSGIPLPEIEIIDLKNSEKIEDSPLISVKLYNEITSTLNEGKQVILYLNRRGFSNFFLCTDCGFTYQCKNCSVSLTYHFDKNALVCHYCGYTVPVPKRCPNCFSTEFNLLGTGTQKIEKILTKSLKDAKILRVDSDTKNVHTLFSEFKKGKYNLLIGTQMITKGHDFPDVALVGVVLAEHGLKFPDFRAQEFTMQKLIQVAGRAGRAGKGGKVLVQTFVSDHYIFNYLKEHDYEGFAKKEISLRESRKYPPAYPMMLIESHGRNPIILEKNLMKIKNFILANKKRKEDFLRVLGPSPAPIKKIRQNVRYHLILISRKKNLLNYLGKILKNSDLYDPNIIIDVDPVNLL